MQTRWLGGLLVAVWCATALAHARAETNKPRKNDAKAESKPDSKADSKTGVKKPPKVDVMTLTNDPQLGKADRVEGFELKGMVTFTFDDGPSPTTTPAVLDALEKYNVPATFFIVSRRITGKLGEKSRQVLQRQVKGGFTIASHSFTHPNLRGATAAKLTREIDDAIRILAKESGKQIALFRAPFGALDAKSRGWLKKRGLTEAFWSVDTLDWKAKDVQRLRKKTMSMILKQEGGVVLLHDIKPITAKVTPLVLDDLEAENCKRLADKKDPILPVAIHYFIRDKGKQRPIPDEVKKRTAAYRAALPGRCAKRPPPPEPPKADNKDKDPKKADPKKADPKKPAPAKPDVK